MEERKLQKGREHELAVLNAKIRLVEAETELAKAKIRIDHQKKWAGAQCRDGKYFHGKVVTEVRIPTTLLELMLTICNKGGYKLEAAPRSYKYESSANTIVLGVAWTCIIRSIPNLASYVHCSMYTVDSRCKGTETSKSRITTGPYNREGTQQWMNQKRFSSFRGNLIIASLFY